MGRRRISDPLESPTALRRLVMLFLSIVTPGRRPEPDRRPTSYSIQGWFTENGLPSDKIRESRKTRDGYLWLATRKGSPASTAAVFTTFTGAPPRMIGGGFVRFP